MVDPSIIPTESELLAEIIALVNLPNQIHPPGAYTAQQVADADPSGSSVDKVRDRLNLLAREGKINKQRFGQSVYYWVSKP